MTSWLRACLLVVLSAVAAPLAAGEPSALEVRGAWARATPPGAAVAAAYLTIRGGAEADRLLGAQTEIAAMTQIHAVTDSAGVARMREVEAVEVPARGVVELAPHGLHLMLMHLERPLVAGQRFVVTLRFERAGAREVAFEVVAPGDAPASAQR